jgi:hypothetical protein
MFVVIVIATARAGLGMIARRLDRLRGGDCRSPENEQTPVANSLTVFLMACIRNGFVKEWRTRQDSNL